METELSADLAKLLHSIENGWLVEKGETFSNLSVAVPSFSSDIFIYQLCFHHVLKFQWQPSNSSQLWPKINFSEIILYFFLYKIAGIHEFVCTIHKHSGLTFCPFPFLDSFKKRWNVRWRIQDCYHMTSLDVVWRHYRQKWYLVEQAQGYLINGIPSIFNVVSVHSKTQS